MGRLDKVTVFSVLFFLILDGTILLRSGESWEAISLEGLFEINQLYLP
jgi:hypothetical protein